MKLAAVAEHIGGQCHRVGAETVQGLCSLADIRPGYLAFATEDRLLPQLAGATAAIVKPQWVNALTIPVISVDNPYLAYAKASQLFAVRPAAAPGVAATAVIAASATVADDASIAAGAVIEAAAVIAAGAVIGANCVVGARSKIGTGSRLFANVCLYHDVVIGNNCEIGSGAVVGSDGFGFAPCDSGWQPIAQNGGVVIGDRVFIGANTTIDRGALQPTVIADGVIIDNQVQIAHNCVIGENTAIAGCVGIAGSSSIGKNCLLAGGVGVVGHLQICDGVQINARARVTKSITEPGVYASGTPLMKLTDWRKAAALFARSIKPKKHKATK